MEFFSFLIISIIIPNISSQDYCDSNLFCSECTYCGFDTNDYCSCDFYHSFCLNEDKSENFNSDFLLNYDGCLTSNKESEICGGSSISIKDGETKTISYDSTDKTEFLCYYYFKGSSNNNKFTFTINSEGEQIFDIYLIIYQKDISPKVTSISSSAFTHKLEIIKSNVEEGSIYFDIGNGKNLDKVSINILYNENQDKDNDDQTTTVTTSKSNGSSNTGLIVGIIVGAVALIALITIGICVYFHYKKKEKLKISSATNSTLNQNVINVNDSNYKMNPQYLIAINKNKQKLEQMFTTELLPRFYEKNNVINDCYNCTICMENFIEKKSVIITTKCNHSFHEKCFKNWAYKNIICPKCPNCNYLILGPQDSALQNITIPSSMDYTIQTNPNTITQE